MQAEVNHLSLADLEPGLDEIRNSPKQTGKLDLIVCRPAEDARQVLEQGELDVAEGLVGDSWKSRSSTRSADGKAHPDMQINIMNSRLAQLVAHEKERWQLAGDQLFIDLDLSAENLPPGTQLSIGSAVLQITDQPHTGCKKFAARFGADALRLINSPAGKELQLRGVNAKVVRSGTISAGDTVNKT